MGDYDTLLQTLREQENKLQFTRFSSENALEIGLALLKGAVARGKAVTIDITRYEQQLFHYAMEGTSADQDAWIKRKANVVRHFGHSSYYMGISLKNVDMSMQEKYLLPESEYAPHGGSFPLLIRGAGMVGTITVAGMSQAEDHELVVETLENML